MGKKDLQNLTNETLLKKESVNSKSKIKLVIITGATATGKTEVALKVAKLINAEIVSADSMQIYKKLDIATAKVTKIQMQEVKHHMIDIIEPFENYSVSNYKKDAIDVIKKIHSQGKNIVVVGGTGLYIHSLLYDMDFEKTFDLNRRKELNIILEKKGKEYLYDYLKSLSLEISKKIHINNTKKIIRAIEILETKDLNSDFNFNEMKKNDDFDIKLFILENDREKMYEKINKRVDEMVENHLLDEIKYIKSLGLTKSHQSMKAIGYREFFESENIDQIIENIKKDTRHYAKRQITWFKKYDFAKRYNVSKLSFDKLIENIIKDLDTFY